jgi:two-component system, LytTR family, response regulator
MKILIVDDEPLARQLIRNYLEGFTEIEISGECENGFEALKAINNDSPDLILLDVQMPRINGFEMLEVLDKKPAVIFTTAYDQYAIRAFEMNAVDYLLKPFSKERLMQSIEKAKIQIQHKKTENQKALEKLAGHLENNPVILERVVVKHGQKVVVIPLEEISYLEAQDDYVLVYSENGNFLKEKTMKYFETHLPANSFIRIHRSHIVNISRISSIEQYNKDTHLVILKDGKKLRASGEGYKRLKEIL